MTLFSKNPNYNPNDPSVNRYLPIADQTPKINAPKLNAGALNLFGNANASANIFSGFTPSSSKLSQLGIDTSKGLNIPKNAQPLSGGGVINPSAVLPGTTPTPTPTPTPTEAPSVAPSPSLVPSPAPSPVTPTTKAFYREGGSLFDSETGRKILDAADLKSGGYNAEVAKPSGIASEGTEAFTKNASDLEIQNILKLAGEAGLSATDAMGLVDNYNALNAKDREAIKTSLGISDVVASAFKEPEQTTVDYFNKGYLASKAPELKNNISSIDETIAQRRKDLATAVEDLQNNPWLSQASRTGRLGILNTKATNDINNLLNQRQQYLDEYDKEITNLESDVTRYATQLETDRTINANKLNYLLNEAEKMAATTTSEKKTSNLRFLPSYLQAKSATETAKNAYELEKARLENIKLAQETGATGEATNVEGSYTNLSQGIVGGYNIGAYATDPNHERAVQSILTGIGKMNSVADMDAYIKRKYPNSPVTGQMIANAAGKYGVSWEMMMAMMEQDSSMGTAGKGARTYNPGNVGNTDSGATKNYGNWQAGVDAVASWLSRHKSTAVAPSATGYTNDQMSIAQSIMSPGSTLTVSGIKQSERPGVEAAMNVLREQAKQSGDIYGVMKASAGGAKMDTTSVKDLSKFGTAVTQLVDLKKEIDNLKAKGGTGAFSGRITDKKFWNADNATIKAKLQGSIPTIARGVFGEVGVLTDQDIENYKQTIPNIKTPSEAVDRIYQGLLSTINSKILSTYESYANAGYDVSGFADSYKNLQQSIAAQSMTGIKVKNPKTGEIRSGAGLTAQDIADAKKQGYEIIQ